MALGPGTDGRQDDGDGSPGGGDEWSPQRLASWNLPWLYVGRGLRSFVTAFLTVVFPLYLAARHESTVMVGTVLTVTSLISAVLVLLVGLLGDRVGRKPMLLLVAGLGVVGCVLLAAVPDIGVIMVASGLGSIGQGGGAGSGGAFGPFYPAEQPLLAASVPAQKRTWAFGLLGAVGVAGGALGSLVLLVPNALHAGGVSLLTSYRLMFLIGAGLSLLIMVACVALHESPRRRAVPRRADDVPGVRSGGSPDAGGSGVPISLRQVLGRLTLTNALNGLGYGFMGPLLVYWFHVRFGVGSGVLGTLYFVINLLTVASYLGAAKIVRGLGAVNAVVASRAAGIVALLAMAFMSSFDLAAALLAARTLFNSLSKPARDSYMMGVVEEGRRSMVAGASQLPGQVSSSVSPAVGAALMPVFQEIPIVGAAFFQTLNVLTYYLAFRRVAERDEPARGFDGGGATVNTGRAAIDRGQTSSGAARPAFLRPAPRAASDLERDNPRRSDD